MQRVLSLQCSIRTFPKGVEVSPAGDYIYATGFFTARKANFSATISIQNSDQVGHCTSGATCFDGWVGKFRASDGEPIWAITMGGDDAHDATRDMAIGTAGDIVVVGSYQCSNFTVGPFTLYNTNPLQSGWVFSARPAERAFVVAYS